MSVRQEHARDDRVAMVDMFGLPKHILLASVVGCFPSSLGKY